MTTQELVDSELHDHLDSFHFPLNAGKKEAWEQLQIKFTSSRALLEERQNDVNTLRSRPDVLETIYSSLKSLKKDEACLENSKQSQTETAAEGQIFFQGDMKPLNTIPFLLTFIVFCKIWIFPVLGLMTPAILFISPYIILQTVFGMNITWELYIVMMKQLMFGIQGNEPWTLKHGLQMLWTIVGLGQGIVQPFLTSYHTAKVDLAIVEQGNALINIHSTLKDIHSQLRKMKVMKSCPLTLPDIPYDPREAVAWMKDEPLGMKLIWKLLGRICLLTTLAHDTTWTQVEFNNGPLTLTNISDLAIKNPIYSDLTLKGHSLLTGPNRGGKSSSLRAILQQVLLGQTFGFTKGCVGSWKPFYKVMTRLKSRDTSGKESLFEMEVRNASRMIHSLRSNNSPALILIDELFHSTNPPDAETSARVFLDQLWTLPNVKSIISTHIFSLCEDPPKGIDTFCCPATMNDDESIDYTYTLREGVCRLSSVKEVLQEAGLCGQLITKKEPLASE
jgi:hypothetical protein